MTVVGGAVIACSNSDAGTSSACADITGNYTVTEKTISTNCKGPDGGAAPGDPSQNPAPLNVSIQRVNGAYSAIIPGLNGACPGTLDPNTCKFELFCNITTNGATEISFSIDWTIKDGTLGGSEIDQAFPPVVASQCQLTAADNGNKL